MTDTTFTLKQNAKRAASRMIAKGSAPSLEFDIVPQGTLFAIQWGAPIAKTPVDDDGADVCVEPEAVRRAGSAERLATAEPGSVTPLVQCDRTVGAVHFRRPLATGTCTDRWVPHDYLIKVPLLELAWAGPASELDSKTCLQPQAKDRFRS